MLLLPTLPLIWCKSLNPKLWALLMKIVLALGTSKPLSIIVVETRTSYSPLINSNIVFSRIFPSNLPWTTATWAEGINLKIIFLTSWIFSILLWTKNTWPSLLISKFIASLIVFSSNEITLLSIGYLFWGGEFIIDKSLADIKLYCSVLGIGVAVKVKTSIFCFSDRIFSFTLTPNFCSSSTISKPRFLKLILLFTIWWVPIIRSILPLFNSSIMVDFSLDVLNLFK